MRYAAFLLLLIAAPGFAQELKELKICGPDGNEQCVAGGAPPRAAVTVGTEPTYTTEPVTQQMPHCPAGKKLKQFDPAFYWMVAVAGNASTNPITCAQVPPEHGDRWIDAGDTDDIVRVDRKFRCFDDPPVLHRRDEGIGITGEIAVSPTPFTTNDAWTTITPSFTISAAKTYTFPAGTKCGPEGDVVVCHMPDQGK
jgi:hypothetical protein